jgi:hypothetical protein
VLEYRGASQQIRSFRRGSLKASEPRAMFFVIKTIIDRYLRFKRRRLYWCFVDFEKAFESIHGDAWGIN